MTEELPATPRAAVHGLIDAFIRTGTRFEALLLVDLDRFRAVNEALGSEIGDQILASVGNRLNDTLGQRGRLIRLEADRFLILGSPQVTCPRALAEALLRSIRTPFDLAGRHLSLRGSVGVVVPRAGECSPVRLLMLAESALRRAKAAGGDRVEVHEAEAHAATLDRARLELDLREALEAGEFGLAYQPYVNLRTGEVDGVEALLRWRHPTRGEIAPATFIPLAEATGQILPLGIWALHTACATAAAAPSDLTLAVNISPIQFHAADFVEAVDAVLAETGFPASRLELEITETVLMRGNQETVSQLEALTARGIRIALDDFGTGYSGLAYLGRLPHHRIKLDKSFVQDIGRSSTAALVRAIVALARAGGIATTAEGVETPEQLRAVRELGFTHAQGFATGKPFADPGQLVERLSCE